MGRRSRRRRPRSPRSGAPAPALPLARGRRRHGRLRHRGGTLRRHAARHLDSLARRMVPPRQLAEPGAVLGDEVEREAVPRRRHRARTTISSPGAARRDRAPATRCKPVPDDGVAALVEPVVRGGDVGAPGGSAGILDLGRALCQRPGARRSSDHERQRATRGPGTALWYDRAGAPSRPRVPARAGRADPVWFMRQAGRSLPEYRALREAHGLFELAGTPELCAEVTLQPVRRYGVDAAVLFADIMTPVLAMGVDVQLVEGVGPVVEHRSASPPTPTACARSPARGDAGGDSPDPRRARPPTRRS